MSDNYIDIVFDGPPSHEAGRFVEVENEQGQSINAGEWIAPGEDSDFPLWRLRINTERGMSSMAERIHNISTSKGFKEPDLDNLPEKLMLSVSELAEAMEEHRSGKPLVYFEHDSGCDSLHSQYQTLEGDPAPCSCVRKPEGILVEIADSIIRNLHMMHSLIEKYGETEIYDLGLSVFDIVNLKVDYNEGRPAMHGRNY